MTLVGGDLYVANTDAIVRYPYVTGATKITGAGMKVTDVPGGPINHHWTKRLTASRTAPSCMLASDPNRNITENGIKAEKNRAAIWQIDCATGRARLYATVCAIRTA